MQEFPVVLLQWRDRRSSNRADNDDEDEEMRPHRELFVASTFHEYVRPTWQPKISTFCTSLTGITQVYRRAWISALQAPSRRRMAKGWRCPQAQIDKADAFPEVVDRVREWLRGLDLVDEDEQLVDGVCWCTDGVRLRVRRLHTEADLTAPSPAAVGPPRFCKWLAVRGRNTH